ncbi:hypothetical protein F0U60_41075 [Archangium minus]|uniref:Uncharacterized protein n=1 Tax=Archangium minus TaxID=83450 RepID=A0ABY9X324_9BACT|nr:hypothetical protein F0U61_40765 [Archangium violaceum]WNG49807.1 hypothetical protein F0U60_41075 [Archangium minus]
MQNAPEAQRRAWRLKTASHEYEVIREFELDEEEAPHVVPPEELQREFDGWVRYSLNTLRSMLGAMDRVLPDLSPTEESRQLKRLLTDLFQSGRLVAFRREPRQPALSLFVKPAPPVPKDVVDAAVLAQEPKPAQATPTRNVNVAQQDSCLGSAAQDGTPFCEVCENIKRGITT